MCVYTVHTYIYTKHYAQQYECICITVTFIYYLFNYNAENLVRVNIMDQIYYKYIIYNTYLLLLTNFGYNFEHVKQLCDLTL